MHDYVGSSTLRNGIYIIRAYDTRGDIMQYKYIKHGDVDIWGHNRARQRSPIGCTLILCEAHPL